MKANKITTWTIKDKKLIPRNHGCEENKKINFPQEFNENKL